MHPAPATSWHFTMHIQVLISSLRLMSKSLVNLALESAVKAWQNCPVTQRLDPG